jgi:protein gp37
MFREKKMYGQEPNVVVRSKTTFEAPLKWKEPRLIFTCSWSDWFVEEADAWRDEAWDVIRRTPQHTYQILTKRIDRAVGRVPVPLLPNVWLGVSVEDQQRADERIPLLLQTPAAVRFLSVEPMLGPVDLRPFLAYMDGPEYRNGLRRNPYYDNRINWVIIGGESGAGARPFDVAWARSAIAWCKAAGVPVFVKQLGAKPVFADEAGGLQKLQLHDKKGGSINEWPSDLQTRSFPDLLCGTRVKSAFPSMNTQSD